VQLIKAGLRTEEVECSLEIEMNWKKKCAGTEVEGLRCDARIQTETEAERGRGSNIPASSLSRRSGCGSSSGTKMLVDQQDSRFVLDVRIRLSSSLATVGDVRGAGLVGVDGLAVVSKCEW
jgi:hypothetical protein